MKARIAVTVFPGTNCEFDVVEAYSELGIAAELVPHTAHNLDDYEAVVIPGGFSYGDYLRPGAIARFAPVMEAITHFASLGRPILGICNGFQVLTEAKLLPGALQKNTGLSFICDEVEVEVTANRSYLSRRLGQGQRFNLPINHFEGNYTAPGNVVEELFENDRVVLKYTNNPNGSAGDIAGICNEKGNVVAMMPHPERAGNGFGLTEEAASLLLSLVE